MYICIILLNVKNIDKVIILRLLATEFVLILPSKKNGKTSIITSKESWVV